MEEQGLRRKLVEIHSEEGGVSFRRKLIVFRVRSALCAGVVAPFLLVTIAHSAQLGPGWASQAVGQEQGRSPGITEFRAQPEEPVEEKRYFPFYRADSDFFVGFGVSNPLDQIVNLTFAAYEEDGELAPYPNNPAHFELGQGQLAMLGSEIFQIPPGVEQSGWVELTADSEDIGAFFQYGNNSITQLDGGNAIEHLSPWIWFSRIHSGLGSYNGADAETYLSIINPNKVSVPVRLTLFRNDGEAIAEANRTIAAKGQLYEAASELFDRSKIESAYVRAECGDPTGSFDYSMAGFELIQLNDTVIGLNAHHGNAMATELYSAQLAETADYLTSLKLINLNTNRLSADRTVTIVVLGEGGQFLVSPMERELALGEAFEERLSSLFTLPPTTVGSIKVEIEDDPGVVGDVIFGHPDGSFAAALPLQMKPISWGVFNQVANLPGYFTGLALYNPGERKSVISAQVYAATGKQTGIAELDFAPNERRARVLPELVPETAGQARGYIEMNSTEPFVVQELLGNAHTLSAVPPNELFSTPPLDTSGPQLVNIMTGALEAPYRQVFQSRHTARGYVQIWKSRPFSEGGLTGTFGAVVIGDVDTDGVDEIVAVNPDGDVRVYRQGSMGVPALHTKQALIPNPDGYSDVRTALVADVDNDGQNELLVHTFYRAYILEYESGTLEESTSLFPSGRFLYGICAGDPDNDGLTEVLMAVHPNGLLVHDNHTVPGDWTNTLAESIEPLLQREPPYVNPLLLDVVRVRDFNPSAGDGNEILLGGNMSRGAIVKYSADRDKYEAVSVSPRLRDRPTAFTHAVAAGDLDGDGDLEAVLGGGFAAIYAFDINGWEWTEISKVNIPWALGRDAIQTGDFDNDGRDEIAISSYSDGTASSLYRGLSIVELEGRKLLLTYKSNLPGLPVSVKD